MPRILIERQHPGASVEDVGVSNQRTWGTGSPVSHLPPATITGGAANVRELQCEAFGERATKLYAEGTR